MIEVMVKSEVSSIKNSIIDCADYVVSGINDFWFSLSQFSKIVFVVTAIILLLVVVISVVFIIVNDIMVCRIRSQLYNNYVSSEETIAKLCDAILLQKLEIVKKELGDVISKINSIKENKVDKESDCLGILERCDVLVQDHVSLMKKRLKLLSLFNKDKDKDKDKDVYNQNSAKLHNIVLQECYLENCITELKNEKAVLENQIDEMVEESKRLSQRKQELDCEVKLILSAIEQFPQQKQQLLVKSGVASKQVPMYI